MVANCAVKESEQIGATSRNSVPQQIQTQTKGKVNLGKVPGLLGIQNHLQGYLKITRGGGRLSQSAHQAGTMTSGSRSTKLTIVAS